MHCRSAVAIASRWGWARQEPSHARQEPTNARQDPTDGKRQLLCQEQERFAPALD